MATPVEPRVLEKSEPRPGFPGVGGVRPSIETAVIGILLLLAFWPILVGLYGSWFDQYANMEHGILVLPAAAYMVWSSRDKLARIPIEPSSWGVLVLVLGALQAMFGIAAHWIWVSRTSLLVSLIGAIASVFGWRMVRELAYPLGTLVLMITPPTFIYERLTLSLQLIASRLGEVFLETLGYSVLREGNILELPGVKLSVEEACSGIRSLTAILFMCVIYNFFFVEGRGMRWIILVTAVPIAILGNALRILATGIASQYDPALVQGAAHEAFGYVSIAAAAAGCLAVHIVAVSIQKSWREHRG
jgi:exosortase